jgi:peptide-methionine (R)-S-oxide reductase
MIAHKRRQERPMAWNNLTPEETYIIVQRGTERPFTGEYDALYKPGTYICRRCNAPLFSSESKFDAGCGWPAFDASYPDALQRLRDPDGRRTEIRCAHCGGHLGHEFVGERLTEKNTRECVNSLAIRFVPAGQALPGVLN